MTIDIKFSIFIENDNKFRPITDHCRQTTAFPHNALQSHLVLLNERMKIKI